MRICGRQLLDPNTNQSQTYGRAHFEELNFHLCMYKAASCWKQTMLTVTQLLWSRLFRYQSCPMQRWK